MIAIKEMRERLDWKPNCFVFDTLGAVMTCKCKQDVADIGEIVTDAINNMMEKSDK